MSDELDRNTDAVERLVDELKAVRDSVEELYLLLDHAWRNRLELLGVLEQKTAAAEIAETIACTGCDADSPASLAEALQAGWSRLQHDDGPGWNYLGICPACQQQEMAETKDRNSERPVEKTDRGDSQTPFF